MVLATRTESESCVAEFSAELQAARSSARGQSLRARIAWDLGSDEPILYVACAASSSAVESSFKGSPHFSGTYDSHVGFHEAAATHNSNWC